MKIKVVNTANQAKDIDFDGHIAVVIDVLRATSVITTALENGANSVIPVETVEEAQSLYAASDPKKTLRGGERHAVKIEGFDLGNSPLEYKPKTVESKDVILTTTNGTQAIQSVKSAAKIVLACLRNAAAVAEILIREDKDVAIVCAGTEGNFSLDDGLCAGYLLHLLKEKTAIETDDYGILLECFYRHSAERLMDSLSDCFHVKRLKVLGFSDDIVFCLQANSSRCVPVEQQGRIIRLR